MADLSFDDLIPQAKGGAGAPDLSFDDLIPEEKARPYSNVYGGEMVLPDERVQEPQAPRLPTPPDNRDMAVDWNPQTGQAMEIPTGRVPGQGLAGAAANALSGELKRSAAQVLAGFPRVIQGFGAASRALPGQQIAVMDKIDRGEQVAQQDDPLGYQFMSPQQRQRTRSNFAAVEHQEPGPDEVYGKTIADEITKAVDEHVQRTNPVDVRQAEKWPVKLAGMVGGTAPLVVATALEGLPGAVGAAFAQTYEQTFEDAINHGANPGDAHASALLNGAVNGGLMSVPAAQWMGSLTPSMRNGLLNAAVGLAVHGGTMVGITQAQQLAGNLIAKGYDPQRDVMQGIGSDIPEQFALGALLPLAHQGFGAAVNAAQRARQPIADPALRAGVTNMQAAMQGVNDRVGAAEGAGGQSPAPPPQIQPQNSTPPAAPPSPHQVLENIAEGKPPAAPPPAGPRSTAQVQREDGVGGVEAQRRHEAEAAAGEAARPPGTPIPMPEPAPERDVWNRDEAARPLGSPEAPPNDTSERPFWEKDQTVREAPRPPVTFDDLIPDTGQHEPWEAPAGNLPISADTADLAKPAPENGEVSPKPAPPESKPEPAAPRPPETQLRPEQVLEDQKGEGPSDLTERVDAWKRDHGPDGAMARSVAEMLGDTEPTGSSISSRNIQMVADHVYGGTLAEGKYTRDQLYDAIETGVNRYIAEHPERFDPRAPLDQAKAAADMLAKIKDRLPTQTVRAGDKDKLQQYSTPPDYAYAAAWAANLRPTDRVIEPSAGNGGLAVFAKNAGAAEVNVNEISDQRARNLGDQGFDRVTRENAEQLHNALPDEIKPTAVIMNPPFSSAGDRMAGKKMIGIGGQHIEQALQRLDPGGRLVAIVGRGMGPDAPAFRDWWKKIGNQYDVRANVGVGGGIYRKYGTTFGTRLLVIDKVPPSGRPVVKNEVQDAHGLLDALAGVRDDRPSGSGSEQVAAEPGRPEVAQGGEGAAGPAGAVRPAAGELGAGRPEGRPAGAAEPVPTGGARNPGAARPPAAPRPEAGAPGNEGAPRLPGDVPGGSGVDNPERPGTGEQPGGSGGVGDRAGAPENDRPQSELKPTEEQVKTGVVIPDQEHGGDLTESVYEAYKPQRVAIEGAKPHPGPLVQSAAMASVLPPSPDYNTSIPKRLIQSGALSDAQLEAVVYAGNAHQHMLPADEKGVEKRRGFFIGDGCVAAGTRIFNPDTGEHVAIEELMRRGTPHTVLSLTPDGFRPHQAKTPFRKGVADLYRVVLDDGRAITVTGQHRFLTPIGWRKIDDGLAPGDLLASAEGPGVSASTPSATRGGDGPNWSGIPQGCQGDYSEGRHPCDALPRTEEGSDPALAPSLAGALGHSLPSWRKDGPALSEGCTLPSRDAAHQTRRSSDRAAIRALGLTVAPTGAVPALLWPATPQGAGLCRPEIALLLRPETEAPHHQSAPASDLSRYETGAGYLSVSDDRLSSAASLHNARLGSLCECPQDRPTPSRLSADQSATREASASVIHSRWNRVAVVTFIRRDEFFDMYVPGPQNYVAEGFVNHNTGVGKGREVAGIILDNWHQGRRRAVWLSEKPQLATDAKRDWTGLGGKAEHIVPLSKIKAGDAIPIKEGILFGSYATLRSEEKVKEAGKTPQSRVDQIVNWLGKDFDGVLAFDEAHNMGNAVAMKGKRGVKEASQQALAGLELQDKLPNARIVYVSATGATEVSNLAYADRLGLWGKGTAFANQRDFLSRVSQGGVAAMELVARDMKALGHYMARNLSYDGVEYDRLLHPIEPAQRVMYDKIADAWQVVLKNFQEALATTGADKNGKAKSAMASAFWGSHQRFFNQLITSLQMPTAIKSIERDVAEGRQAVLQLVNTNEAGQERALDKSRAAGDTDLEELDMSPRDQLMQLVEKTFPVQQHEDYVDDNGNLRSRPVVDSNGNPVLNKEAVAAREKLLDELGSLRVPNGPLEILLDHFGPDAVAEVTGRKQRVVSKPDDKGVMRKVVDKRGSDANIAEANAFQGGKKKILIFSQAGGTGRSYHADNGAPSSGARRSHYLIQAGWRADTAVQGFGRTHRTNQASAPIFHLVTTDLEGQKRFISSIARRLGQLGALTKGERRTGDQGMFGLQDNLESDEAKAGLTQFYRDVYRSAVEGVSMNTLEKGMGLKLRDENGTLLSELPPMQQFLNRVLSLRVADQNHVFGSFADRFRDVVDRAAAAGTLDAGVETYKADKITKKREQVVYTDPQSGAETKHVHLETHTKNHPVPFEAIAGGKSSLTNLTKPEFYVKNKRSGQVYAVAKSTFTKVEANGAVTEHYRVASPLRYAYSPRHEIDYGPNYEKVNPTEAKQLWDERVAKTPEYAKSDLHLITGAVLPIWDRLGGSPQVFRLQTDDGQRMLGRVVDNKAIGETLRRLGAEGEKVDATPAQVASRVLDGDEARLANGWTIKRSLVAGEQRLELKGNDLLQFMGQLERDGVYRERINYDTRYFIPTGEKAAEVLERVLQGRPITSLGSPTGEARFAMRRPQSLLTFLSSKGGIKDESGELRARDLSKARPGLVRKSGRTLDYAREVAEQAGYLRPGSDINDLLHAIDEELSGRKVHPEGDEAEAANAEHDRRGQDEADRIDEFKQEVQAEAQRVGIPMRPEEIEHAATLRLTGEPLEDAVHEALRTGDAEMAGQPTSPPPGANGERLPSAADLRRTEAAGAAEPDLTPAARDARNRLYRVAEGMMRFTGLPQKVGLRFVEKLTGHGGVAADAAYGRGMIEFALDMDAGEAPGRLWHEAVHGLMDPELGLLTPGQRRALEAGADRWLGQGKIGFMRRAELRQMGYSEGQIREEAIARMSEEALARGLHPRSLTGTAIERMRTFARGLGQALRGQGFRTADDVFNSLMRGDRALPGSREAMQGVPPAPARAQSPLSQPQQEPEPAQQAERAEPRETQLGAADEEFPPEPGGASLNDVLGDRQFAIRAYHGSPHPGFDRFDKRFHLTGEGDHFEARGHYFTSDEGLAQNYRDELARPGQKGSVYQVNLKAEPHDLLDWDRPLSEQSPPVRDALQKMGVTNERSWGADAWHQIVEKRIAAGDTNPEASAARMLSEAGIPGTKYRDADHGIPNYVMFDDDKIDIERRYALRPRNQGRLALPTPRPMSLARKAVDEMQQWFSPTSRKGAKPMEYLVRGRAALQAQSAAQSMHALDQFRHVINRLPQAEQLDLTDRMERGLPMPTPELQEVANAIRQQLDTWTAKIQSLGRGQLENARENYMGRIWANYDQWAAGQAAQANAQQQGLGQAVAAGIGKKPIRGSGNFLKRRSFDTLADGMAAGLIPVTTNPIEMQTLKLREMQKYYHGTRLADEAKRTGIARWVPVERERDAQAAGMVKLDDRVFQPTQRADPHGTLSHGNWYAAEPAARIFNNYVSSGMAAKSVIYDAVRASGNALNSAQLALSGFHATFVSMDTMVSRMALGLQQVSRGDIGRGAVNIALGISPHTVASTMRKGSQLRAAYLDPQNASPEMRQVVNALTAGGGRINMDQFYRSNASGSFFKNLTDLRHPDSALREAWQMARDTPLQAPFKLAGRVMDTMMEPLMGQVVPRAKLGVFSDLATDWLRRNPTATPEQTSAAMTKFWDSVDNRLGQLVYDNLFWSKTMKDSAFISTRSVGWNLGTIRELGGGVADTAAQVAGMARGKAPELTTRMAYLLAMPTVTAVYGALLTYLSTGRGPQEMMDYFYPPTGGEDGERRIIPGYIKDVMAYAHAPVQTVLNKAHPLIGMASELYKNRDYYGGIIRSDDDNPVTAYAEYLLNQSSPFSVRAQRRLQGQGASMLDQALSFWGIQPAPASITNPERAENFQRRDDMRALRRREKQQDRIHIFSRDTE